METSTAGADTCRNNRVVRVDWSAAIGHALCHASRKELRIRGTVSKFARA